MFLIKKPAPSRMIYKSQKEKDILQQLDDFIESHTKEPVQILARLWEDQQNAIGYPEIREAILTGQMNEKRIQTWMQDYSRMAAKKFAPVWLQAIRNGGAGQPATKGVQGFSFQSNTKAIRKWVAERSAALVTAVTNEQKDAIKVMIGRAIDGKYTVDELSRVIRPCIGLTRPQATANQRYYETIRDNLLSQHPRMKVESAQKQAREMALKYAEKQHRQRAYMIAETELASAYNQGNDQAVKQAQQQGLLGAVHRIGCTAADDRVCSDCSDREGKELAEGDIPPWHPRCRCTVLYEPIGKPLPDSQIETV